jgi:hypothetical protein
MCNSMRIVVDVILNSRARLPDAPVIRRSLREATSFRGAKVDTGRCPLIAHSYLVVGALTLLSSLGCGSDQAGASVAADDRRIGESPDRNNDLPLEDPTQIDSRLALRLREIAAEYRSQYTRLIGGVRWAPEFCSAPPLLPSLSMATAGTPHGQKLYYLFVKDAYAYAVAGEQPQPIGQAIVKESWTPEEVKATDDLAWPDTKRDDRLSPFAPSRETNVSHLRSHATRNGRQYRPGRQADLFIMFKVEPDTNGTDSGWVYGTVTPDGKHVTSAGRLAACMECHQSAKPDRVFGAKATASVERD